MNTSAQPGTSVVRSRVIPLGVVALVAALFALVLTLLPPPVAQGEAAASGGQQTHAHGQHDHAHAARVHNAKQLRFHDQMRKLWEDHVTWTRLAIVTFAADTAGFDTTAGRLLENQSDIGSAIRPFYGRAAGYRLTALLNEHILIAVDILRAAKAGDGQAVTDANVAWQGNADEIADFLSAANPTRWHQRMMRAMMRTHLTQTLDEASHELTGDFAGSITDYEQVHAHMLVMADVLSSGIIAQFPGRFR